METILGLIGPALFGAGTGGLGLIFSGITKAFTWYADMKEKEAEHKRVMELTKLNAEIRDKEFENERQIEADRSATELRNASYAHDTATGKASRWVVDILRLVRPVLTVGLIVLLGIIYFTIADLGTKAEIVGAVIYMAVSSVTWWFGDRMTQRKR